jgi:phosphoribosyl-AMP cyclohydrolase
MNIDKTTLEEGDQLNLDFTKTAKVAANAPDVIPVAVQNIDTNEVILMAYVNQEALKASVETRIATFWSTSRKELWVKGKTSGEMFDLAEIYVNCEQNSLLFKVRPKRGNICHTKNSEGAPRNCFYRKLNLETGELENLDP